MTEVYFGVIKAHLGSFSISYEGVEQLGVAAEKLLQHRIVFFYRELPPGHLHASLQSPHILQDAVKRNCTNTSERVQCHFKGKFGL